jgi:hypothetical protein
MMITDFPWRLGFRVSWKSLEKEEGIEVKGGGADALENCPGTKLPLEPFATFALFA